jgi:hypothetical protein
VSILCDEDSSQFYYGELVVPLQRCISSRKTWLDEEELNTVSNTKEEALITR